MIRRFAADLTGSKAWWSLWRPVALATLAFAARLYRFVHARNPVDDAHLNVANAFNYVRHGLLTPDNWWTPPLKHGLLRTSIALFGNDYTGWRIQGIIFSTLIVVLVYLLARRVFRSPFVPTCAALLLALDPHAIAYSRTTAEDLPAMVFVLVSMVFWLRAVDKDRAVDLALAGLAIGIAGSLRWYAVFPWFVMCVLAFLWSRMRPAENVPRVFLAMFVIPATVYLVSYLPWIARGYSFGEWLSLQFDAVRAQGAGFVFEPALARFAGPGRWFTGWVGGGERIGSNGGWATYTVMMNDPLLWALFLPAAIYLVVLGVRERDRGWVLIGGTFLALYAFFLSVSRPIILYSALSVTPFGFMVLAFAARRLLQERAKVFLWVGVVWSVYLYPLAAGAWCPVWMYRWLLRVMGVA